MSDIQKRIALAEKALKAQKDYLSDNEISLNYNQMKLEFYKRIAGNGIRKLEKEFRLRLWMEIASLYFSSDQKRNRIKNILEEEYQRYLRRLPYSPAEGNFQIERYKGFVKFDKELVELAEISIKALEFYIKALKEQVETTD